MKIEEKMESLLVTFTDVFYTRWYVVSFGVFFASNALFFLLEKWVALKDDSPGVEIFDLDQSRMKNRRKGLILL